MRKKIIFGTMKDVPEDLPGLNKSMSSSRHIALSLMKTQSRWWQKLDSNSVHALLRKINNMEKVKTTLEISKVIVTVNLPSGVLK